MGSEDLSSYVKAVAITFLSLSWITIALRCYVRIFLTKLFRIEDWLAVLTMIAFSFYCSFVIAGAEYGTGRPGVSTDDTVVSMKWWYCGEITYGITTCLMKISVATFLLKICVHPIQRRIIWTVIITVSIFTAYYVPLLTFQCHPMAFFWDRSIKGGGCLPPDVVTGSSYAHGGVTALADWTLGTVPIFLVWSLQMNIRTKVSAALLLGLGSIGSTATIIRFPYMSNLGLNDNFLYNNANLSIWSTVEAGIGITASSIACLRPLFQAFFFRARPSDSSTHKAQSRNASRGSSRRYMGNGEEEFRSREYPATNIWVTTVIDTYSDRDSREVRMSGIPMMGNENVRGLTRADTWNFRRKELMDDSSGEIGYYPMRDRVEVICRSGSR